MKKIRFPNTYIIVSAVILLCAVATWFVPGGEYTESGDGLPVYVQVDSEPQTWQVFSALYDGFVRQAGIIAFILIIGGTFWIVNSSKAMDVGIASFLRGASRLERHRPLKAVGVDNIVMVSIMLLFSLFGGVFGMSEESIAFVAITIPLAISMGYDSITGVALVYLAAHVGFAGAFLNPFTVGVAQGMAGLPLFSGMGYRIVCWGILTLFLIVFVLLYARRIRKNPEKSPMYRADSHWRKRAGEEAGNIAFYKNTASKVSFAIAAVAIILFTVFFSEGCTLSIGSREYAAGWLLPAAAAAFILLSVAALRKSVHFYILTLLCFTIVYLIIGVLCFDWYIPEITALFLSLAVLAGIAAGSSPNRIAEDFLAGAKDIFPAAMIVGLASGIIIILENGKVIDTILHAAASGLGESGKLTSLTTMYGIQTFINLFITSATAKAAITMPVMAPFSDLIGLSRQATVLAFQFGDGFTNMITPTSGVLMAVLGMAKIPYSKWFRWVWKFILALIAIGFLLLVPTVLFSIEGF